MSGLDCWFCTQRCGEANAVIHCFLYSVHCIDTRHMVLHDENAMELIRFVSVPPIYLSGKSSSHAEATDKRHIDGKQSSDTVADIPEEDAEVVLDRARERWLELCENAVRDQDTGILSGLSEEVNRLLA